MYRAKGAGKNNIAFYSKDKRNYLRVPLNVDITVGELGLEQNRVWAARSINISIGGLLFESDVSIDVGKKVQIRIPLDEDSPLLVIASVVRITAVAAERYQIAVASSFQEMERKIKNRISQWINLKRLPQFS